MFTVSPAVKAGIGVALPDPGSTSIKYSAFTIFWENTEVMTQSIISSMNSLFIPISFLKMNDDFSGRLNYFFSPAHLWSVSHLSERLDWRCSCYTHKADDSCGCLSS